MKKFTELNLGYSDAENFRQREQKSLFNRIFIRTDELDRLAESNISFLVGEKGTGKTAYATYLANNNYKNTLSSIRFIRETEYKKFLTLKKSKHLELSDFTNIWKVILYLLASQQIREKEPRTKIFDRFTKFSDLNKAIDDYYLNAFSPEILYAIQFIEESSLAAELLSKYANLSGSEREQMSFSETRFQQNLRYIQLKFESALGQIKLQNDHLVFIDGIDIRPPEIGHRHYLECIKGLANAVWSINQDVFSQFRDTKGRIRVVLLVRPDIFDTLGLQNQNTKLRDNSVLLDWRTSYSEHRHSTLFQAADRILADDQDADLNLGDAWDHYFPYNASNVNTDMKELTSFIGFLRYSLHRPRDIITMMSMLQEEAIEKGRHNKNFIDDSDFNHSDFRSKYALYLLGEVKDQILFYYRPDEYELFLRFFEFLGGKPRFEYDEFLEAYESLREHIRKSKKRSPFFLRTGYDFLQFLYTLNVISFKEEAEDGSTYIRWCFRERSYSNIAPKIRTDSRYEIHYGLKNALNLGKPIKRKPTRR